MNYELIEVDDKNRFKYNMPIKIQDFDFLLKINNTFYPVFDKSNLKEFIDDNFICINYWSHIAIIDEIIGNLLLYTGFENSVVGVESLKHSFLIVSDTSLTIFNKKYFSAIYRTVLNDYVLDYEIINEQKIKLKFAVDNELILDL